MKKQIQASMMLFAGLWLGACVGETSEGTLGLPESDAPEVLEQSVVTTNGLRAVNGLRTRNGLTALNGLRAVNGLRTVNGLESTVGLMTSSAGRDTVKYIVRCALPAGQTLTKKDQNGVSYTFPGQFGVAPEWADGACDLGCQQSVSACVLAHVNTTGQNISLWMNGSLPGVGWGQSENHPFEEGSFFGNIFVDPPVAHFCNGKDFDKGVVPGRLGTTQTDVPYLNPFGTDAACRNYCTPADSPFQADGYKSCNRVNRVVTVWRNFDPTTNYKICNRATGRCLDNQNTASDGTTLTQRTYNGSSTQKWKVIQVAPKQYKMVNVMSNDTLTVANARLTDGARIVQWPWENKNEQKWVFTSLGNDTGAHTISPAHNPTAAISAPSTNFYGEGQELHQYKYNGATFMQWYVAVAN